MLPSQPLFPPRPIRHRRGVCRSCFDLYVDTRRRDGPERCHACALGVQRSAPERDAIRTFWVDNPTDRHLSAFESWGCERELTRARRSLERFWRRAHRWSARAAAYRA